MAAKMHPLTRRNFLKGTTAAAAGLSAGLLIGSRYASAKRRAEHARKVIVLGFDGMDPRLTGRMIAEGQLPNLAKFHKQGGYRPLGTSTPPQSPVAWANFINGAGPGTHGLFDFIMRDPKGQCAPFYAGAETRAGQGGFEIGDHRLQADFWPFNHQPPETVLRRQGTPFWDYLDRAGIESRFYNLPSNYPPSASKFGHHQCLSGLGTPDMLGTYGTYQHFAQDGPARPDRTSGGYRSRVIFVNETSSPALKLIGPDNSSLKEPRPSVVEFLAHRDRRAGAAVIEIQGRKVLLKQGQWSRWVKLDFEMSMPTLVPNWHLSGIVRFYLQEVTPNFRLYVSPVNVDPSDPAVQISEPAHFIEDISDRLGLFYTTGFQEDHKALTDGIFTDAEFAQQAADVLKERLALLDGALDTYDDGLLFFYFSSTDLQAHMFWWDGQGQPPTRSAAEGRKNFEILKKVYRRMDTVVGDIAKRYGDDATVIAMSDHGFCNFRRQFNLNSWLRENGYLQPRTGRSLFEDVNWAGSRAYGLGINGLYINTAGRERDGIVKVGQEREKLIEELLTRLEAIRDTDGQQVIRKVRRSDEVYSGPATDYAPDLIVGYARGYRASWATCLGGMTEDVLADNQSPWCADHCADASEVPGIVFSNRPIAAKAPSLIDIAPTILAEFGLDVPGSMTGRSIFAT